MEVSALIGHGAGATLQDRKNVIENCKCRRQAYEFDAASWLEELLTVKSDDLQGRQEIFQSLSQGQA